MKILVAITGASGTALAVRFVDALRESEAQVHLVVSKAAETVREHETTLSREALAGMADHVYGSDALDASICSGSLRIDAMVVIPCSMNTLAHIAGGIEHNAITRAAAVSLKQQRTVVLVPRETPLTLPQLRNMVKAKEAGCAIVPPVLCHYVKPRTVADCENYIVGRILELLGIEHDRYTPWEEGS